jgi:translation elongation factor P/translation initiation factor 5A
MASASDVERGNYIMYNNEPHKLIRKEVVAVGTHSHTKLKFYLQPMVGKGEKNGIFGHADSVEILNIIRKSGQVIAKNNGKVQVMDSKSFETLDAAISPELYEEIQENDEVIFVDFNNAATVLEKR